VYGSRGRDIEMNDINTEEDKDDHQPSRNPVGTMDGNEPTEPPDKKEGEQGARSIFKLWRI
jgi:hypothetical protein